jgi:hypothetical protein
MAAKKKSAAKKTSRARKRSGGGDIVFTKNAIVITLSPAEQKKAMRCLSKNGKITFSMKEHSATRLPQLLDNGKLID